VALGKEPKKERTLTLETKSLSKEELLDFAQKMIEVLEEE
jgi:hypothetical protein